jgi:uncharacterized membrane protein YeaQ/YmgE (transglycosylase-associated protein family)
MSLAQLIIFLAIGLAAGWLAERVMRGRGSNLAGSLVVGVIGAIVGGFLFARLGIGLSGVPHLVNSFLAAFAGSILLIVLLRFIKR